MINHNTTPRKSSGKSSNKPTQLQTIFTYLRSNICTASMLSKATGVPQKNICRFKRDLEKCGRLAEVRKDYCKDTNSKAWYITTNPTHFPKNKPAQLNFFDNDNK